MTTSQLRALALAFLVACGAAAKPAPTALELGHHYDRCVTHDFAREVPQVVRCVEELEQRGWSFGLEPGHFKASRGDPAFAAIERRLDARAPRASRSNVAFTAPADIYPENVAFDPKSGDFFLGSTRQRKIVRVTAGELRDFSRADVAPPLFSILGMKVDAARRTLWAATAATDGADAGQSALVVFDVDTGELVARFAPPDAGPHVFNDVVVTAAEDVFVTDWRGNGGVYRVSGRGAMQVFLPAGTLSYPNGIALSPDEKQLYIAHEHGVERVDIASRARTPLAPPAGIPTNGIDGLYLHRGALVAVQNGAGRARVVRWRLDGARIAGVELLESGYPTLDRPTTGVIVDNRFYYIANRNRSPNPQILRVLAMPLD